MNTQQSPTRYIIGLILILVGLGYLFDNIIGINFGQILSDWWAVILVIAGVYHIAKQPERLTSGLIVIAIGGVILADNLFPDIDFWSTFVPILLIIFGIGFLLRDNNKAGVEVKSKFNFNFDNSNNPEYINDEVINVTALFSGAEHNISSKKFRGGKVSATFGGVELDLRSAEMATGEASIDVDSVFGGVEIKVPQSWRVHVSGSPIMGGISNDTFYSPRQDNSSEQLLTIRATVMFGGIEISN